MKYWLNLFSPETWREFKLAGGHTSGFSEGRWDQVRQIREGDLSLCYMTGVKQWFAVLRVTGAPYQATQEDPRIWDQNPYSSRMPVEILTELPVGAGIPARELLEGTDMFATLSDPRGWGLLFRGAPRPLTDRDGKLIYDEIVNPTRQVEDLFSIQD